MMARRLWNADDGATVVEFALIVPMLMLLLVGVMQIGILFHANGGVRELMGWSGRAAMIAYQNNASPPSTTTFKTQITTEAGSGGYGLDTSRLTTNVTVTTNEESGVRSVTITLAYAANLPLPLLPTLTVNLNQTRTYYAPV